MVETPTREWRTTFNVSISQSFARLIDELAAEKRERNRSALVRMALIDMADRDLPKDWRERIGWEEGDAA
jgi:metal-responsive CopG/Arc/MetJ family transcriptional regulator